MAQHFSTDYSPYHKPAAPGGQRAEVAKRIANRPGEATLEELTGPEPELTFTVVHADLTKYTDKALEGRLAYYEREHLFERDPSLRADLKIEVEKTRAEIRRRQLMRFAEAERAFTE
jgi:hypothetical protein